MENIICLDTLALGVHRYEFHLNGEYFRGVEKSELLGGQIDVKAELHLREMDYDIRVAVIGVVQVACDRCLEPMDIHVDAEDDMTADTLDETPSKHQNKREIDLNWLAYELTIVNLPMAHSHQHGGCNPEMDSLLQDQLCTMEDPEEL